MIFASHKVSGVSVQTGAARRKGLRTHTFFAERSMFMINTVNAVQLCNWCKSFRQGRQTVKDALRPGHVQAAFADASLATVDDVVRNDRRETTREISKQTKL